MKVATLRLENLGSRPRRLTATYYAEWVLGTTRAATAAGRDPDSLDTTGYLLTLIDQTRREALNRAKREPFVIYMMSILSDVTITRAGFEPALRDAIQAKWRAEDYHGAGQLIPDELLDAFILCGTVDEVAARAVIAPLEEQIRAILRQHVYGADEETPQGVVMELLRRAGLTVSTLEYGTSGALAAMLAEMPGHGDCFRGGLLACSHQAILSLGAEAAILARHGPVSPEGVTALARLTRERMGADIGLALATSPSPNPLPLLTRSGEGGGQGVGEVHLALDDGSGTPRVAAINYATAPSEMRRVGAWAAINLLRLRLMAECP